MGKNYIPGALTTTNLRADKTRTRKLTNYKAAGLQDYRDYQATRLQGYKLRRITRLLHGRISFTAW